MTVSPGIADEYQRVYHVKNIEVLLSLPDYNDCVPRRVSDNTIRLIHHGNASVSRRIERMIELMDYVDERFSLDLMLVPGCAHYWKRLTGMAGRRANVAIRPPVAMPEIIPSLHDYDIGLFLCPPTNFNLAFTLPNKLFEFIQARLAVAIGPSDEMKKMVEEFDCGIIAQDFQARNLAKQLNQLTSARVTFYKHRSHLASKKLNITTTYQHLDKMLSLGS